MLAAFFSALFLIFVSRTNAACPDNTSCTTCIGATNPVCGWCGVGKIGYCQVATVATCDPAKFGTMTMFYALQGKAFPAAVPVKTGGSSCAGSDIAIDTAKKTCDDCLTWCEFEQPTGDFLTTGGVCLKDVSKCNETAGFGKAIPVAAADLCKTRKDAVVKEEECKKQTSCKACRGKRCSWCGIYVDKNAGKADAEQNAATTPLGFCTALTDAACKEENYGQNLKDVLAYSNYTIATPPRRGGECTKIEVPATAKDLTTCSTCVKGDKNYWCTLKTKDDQDKDHKTAGICTGADEAKAKALCESFKKTKATGVYATTATQSKKCGAGSVKAFNFGAIFVVAAAALVY